MSFVRIPQTELIDGQGPTYPFGKRARAQRCTADALDILIDLQALRPLVVLELLEPTPHGLEFRRFGPREDPDPTDATLWRENYHECRWLGPYDPGIDEGCVASSNPAVQLDFSGIAKGYAVDLAVDRLRALGVPAALVNIGDLRAYSDGQSNWRVGIRDPAGGVLATLLIRGERAVSTSGVDQRYRKYAQKRYPHIIDPRTGYPVDQVVSATVIAQHGIQTDPAATALVVAGPGAWSAVAAALGMDEVLMVLPDGSLEMTPAMAKRLEDGPWQDRSTRIVELPGLSPGND